MESLAKESLAKMENHFDGQVAEGSLYALLIYLPHATQINVGKLGEFVFPAGFYVYVGSARRNLASRIARHRRKEKRLHWHIDYLLQHAEVKEVVIYKDMATYEDVVSYVTPYEGDTLKTHTCGNALCRSKETSCSKGTFCEEIYYEDDMIGSCKKNPRGSHKKDTGKGSGTERSGTERGECRLAAAYARLPGAKILVPGFGSRDCRCISHLIYFSMHDERVSEC